jgi:hypothetical protein
MLDPQASVNGEDRYRNAETTQAPILSPFLPMKFIVTSPSPISRELLQMDVVNTENR